MIMNLHISDILASRLNIIHKHHHHLLTHNLHCSRIYKLQQEEQMNLWPGDHFPYMPYSHLLTLCNQYHKHLHNFRIMTLAHFYNTLYMLMVDIETLEHSRNLLILCILLREVLKQKFQYISCIYWWGDCP